MASIIDVKYEDIALTHYEYHPTIKVPIGM